MRNPRMKRRQVRRPPLPAPRPRRERLANHTGYRERLFRFVPVIVRVLSSQPRISLRRLRLEVRGILGRCSDADTDAALHLMGAAVQFDDGPRGAWRLTLDLSHAPPAISVVLRRMGAS
jgi:hypothetical protein